MAAGLARFEKARAELERAADAGIAALRPGPVTEEAVTAGPEGFAAAREQFATILGWLDGAASSGLDHAELENQLDLAGRELLRLLMQDHVDLRATGEPGRGGRR